MKKTLGCHCGKTFMNHRQLKAHREQTYGDGGHPVKARNPAPRTLARNLWKVTPKRRKANAA